MTSRADAPAHGSLHSPRRAAMARAIVFAAFWIVLMPSGKAGDLAMGAFATFCATWTSLRLLPPAAGRLRMGALLLQVPHLLRESIVAGVDVARRAFSPRVPLAPGFVDFPTTFPRGAARNGFTSITSLLPGSVPAGDSGTTIVYHALDVAQPVVAQLDVEQRRLAQAFLPGAPHA